MRWSATLNLFLLWRAFGASAEATRLNPDLPTVYLYPKPNDDTTQDVVDPNTARLILAQRLGVAAYHEIGDIPDSELRLLSRYGVDTKPPAKDWADTRVLMVVDGAWNQLTHAQGYSQFQLSSSPSRVDQEELIERFSGYVEKTYGASPRSPFWSMKDLQEQVMAEMASMKSSKLVWRRLGNVQTSIDVIYCSVSPDDPDWLSDFAYKVIAMATMDGFALTLITNPRPASGSDEKGAMNSYGKLPQATQVVLNRRQEAPLVEDPPSSSSAEASTSTSTSQPSATSAITFPLTPLCYESAEQCADETNGCSGHGNCVLTRKAPPSGDEKEASECYQCKCAPQVDKNSKGQTRTTFYGGSACQKVDISAPFWLLTLTTGSLLALVGFGVSMLYAMGNAELPSVIGAGVSGPRPK